MKKFVSLLIVGTMIWSGPALARAAEKSQSAAKSPTTLDQAKKTKRIAEIDQKTKMLQDDRTCLQAANSREELKRCKELAKEAVTKLREEKKSRREEIQTLKGK